jgi:hypothetical protein
MEKEAAAAPVLSCARFDISCREALSLFSLHLSALSSKSVCLKETLG